MRKLTHQHQTYNLSCKSRMRDLFALCKYRVVMVMLLCALVGMLLSPATWSWPLACYGLVGIALAASGGGVINHIMDENIDATMLRTKQRPLPSNRILRQDAKCFACILILLSIAILYGKVNTLACVLTLVAVVGYAWLYTVWLKPRTPQNIVIGGLSGASPPLLGSVCLNGHVTVEACVLVLIIYVWTPAHFWSLAIAKIEDYRISPWPMMPVVYGIKTTKKHIVLYALLTLFCSLLPVSIGMFGFVYALVSIAIFIHWFASILAMYRSDDPYLAKQAFIKSNQYLIILLLTMIAMKVMGG